MISPVGGYQPCFKADNHTIDSKTGEYKDPLMKWPMRGAAFTNEVGEAMRPIIGNYANLTWIPVLMYIGADVYDKYKNDRTEYSPNSKRCLKQAIFQGMASVCLPVLAVKLGQNLFSQAGLLTKDKVTLNTKEHISAIAEQFIANGKMRKYEGKDEECKKEFLSLIKDNFEFKHNERLEKNQNNIKNYAEKTILELIDLRKNLLNPNEKIKETCWYKQYKFALENGQTRNVATKSVLTNFQKSKLHKGNIIKTIGGFLALGLAIKPIDNFVENILIGKYVGPQIDNFKNK